LNRDRGASVSNTTIIAAGVARALAAAGSAAKASRKARALPTADTGGGAPEEVAVAAAAVRPPIRLDIIIE
jgi:hypothetical protein